MKVVESFSCSELFARCDKAITETRTLVREIRIGLATREQIRERQENDAADLTALVGDLDERRSI